ncbi:hypothetical protein F383_34212 [Gossypium arboreum]|nr:hypothetical protein F383_34212 [Gossypium arboreum]
MWYTESPALIL